MVDPPPYQLAEYFPRPTAEAKLKKSLVEGQLLVLVLAPDLAGKRWLVEHVAREEKRDPLWLDVAAVDGPADVARQLSKAARVPPPSDVTSAFQLTSFVEGLLDQPRFFVWRHAEAFDDPKRPNRAVVRHAIREWNTAAAYKRRFGNLTQALLTSKPELQAQYWWNVVEAPVEIEDLSPAEIDAYSARLGPTPPTIEAKTLHDTIGNHLHYLRMASRDRPLGLSLPELCANPTHPRGPFRDMYERFAKLLDNAGRDDRLTVRRLLEKDADPSAHPRGAIAESLERRGVFRRGKPGFRYSIFRAFLKEYFTS